MHSIIVVILIAIVLVFLIPTKLYVFFPYVVNFFWIFFGGITTLTLNRNTKPRNAPQEFLVACIILIITFLVFYPIFDFSSNSFSVISFRYFRFPAVFFVISGIWLLFSSIIELRKAREIPVVISGPYKLVRHPQHLAILLLVFGSFLPSFFPASFLAASGFFLWFRKAAETEEEIFLKDTRTEKMYRQYKETVPSLIPTAQSLSSFSKK